MSTEMRGERQSIPPPEVCLSLKIELRAFSRSSHLLVKITRGEYTSSWGIPRDALFLRVTELANNEIRQLLNELEHKLKNH
jgi:hypothetical protein